MGSLYPLILKMELIENREEGDQEEPVEDDADSTNRVVRLMKTLHQTRGNGLD
ncbi:hypothetical protein ACSBR2_005670 [Camellia fascicularis]